MKRKISTVLKVIIIINNIIFPFFLNAQNVKTGLEVLAEKGFDILKGKKVGLITNPTGVDKNLRSGIDLIFKAQGVYLKVLFGPEHGVRGEYTAGESISSSIDPSTGLKIYSLYGETKKPTKEMLNDIDVLIYDIQDIGSRSYTFISTLGLAMEAAAESDIPFIVLDRPNPLGGLRIEGPLVEEKFISFVSQYPIPYIHGMTVGELAFFLNDEGLLKGGIKCKLSVIKMNGWKREMCFEETGLPWVPTSPHIPQPETCQFYPATGIIGELYVANIGVGFTLPFQLFATEWTNADSLARKMNSLNLPGVIFRPVHYKPYYSVSQGKMVHGVQIHLIHREQVNLSLIQFYILQEMHKLRPDKDFFSLCDRSRLDMFDKVCGSDKIRTEFAKDFQVSSILELWTHSVISFRKKIQSYLLY